MPACRQKIRNSKYISVDQVQSNYQADVTSCLFPKNSRASKKVLASFQSWRSFYEDVIIKRRYTAKM